jgi:hypothetical protein
MSFPAEAFRPGCSSKGHVAMATAPKGKPAPQTKTPTKKK